MSGSIRALYENAPVSTPERVDYFKRSEGMFGQGVAAK